ncbi:hypothetical protein ILUMI_13392 [Ignelater luminosus]|uniref:Uncharacterized protein n=1 Tax=Ignelater luminosus TaxID=2038154 RepID=A0A8K0GC12_IGNLU|nr:hypothetical protein ILUMI_13392 [Ignelater luminosus]
MPNMVTMSQTVANILLDYQKQKKLEDHELEKHRLIVDFNGVQSLVINEFHRLGFCPSYDEVKKYLQPGMIDRSPNFDVPPGHFCQWIADNVDHNIAITDGHNTFDGMGVIMCKFEPLNEKPNILSERKVLCWKNWLKAADISAEEK